MSTTSTLWSASAERRGQVHRRGGLADATLLVGQCDDAREWAGLLNTLVGERVRLDTGAGGASEIAGAVRSRWPGQGWSRPVSADSATRRGLRPLSLLVCGRCCSLAPRRTGRSSGVAPGQIALRLEPRSSALPGARYWRGTPTGAGPSSPMPGAGSSISVLFHVERSGRPLVGIARAVHVFHVEHRPSLVRMPWSRPPCVPRGTVWPTHWFGSCGPSRLCVPRGTVGRTTISVAVVRTADASRERRHDVDSGRGRSDAAVRTWIVLSKLSMYRATPRPSSCQTLRRPAALGRRRSHRRTAAAARSPAEGRPGGERKAAAHSAVVDGGAKDRATTTS